MEQIKKTLEGLKTRLDESTRRIEILESEVKDRDARISERDNEVKELQRKHILSQTALDRAEKHAKDSASEKTVMDEINSKNESQARMIHFLEEQVAKFQASLIAKTEEVRCSAMAFDEQKRQLAKVEAELTKLLSSFDNLSAAHNKTVADYEKLQKDLTDLN